MVQSIPPEFTSVSSKTQSDSTLMNQTKFKSDYESRINIARSAILKTVDEKIEKANTISKLMELGRNFEQTGNIDSAFQMYNDALVQYLEPMNALAWLYKEKGELDKAKNLSEMTIKLAPDEANFLDTYAEILFMDGKISKAIEILQKAVKIDPTLRDKLENLKRNNH
jgi:tetratricopeptide (TPR) repeat protein